MWSVGEVPSRARARRLAHRLLLAVLTLVFTVVLGSRAEAASWVWVEEGTALEYFEGTVTAPAGWSDLDYSTGAGWTSSPAGFGIGYGDGDDATVLSTMAGNYLTVYVRSHFTLGPEVASLTHVELEARYDDGFVAYLNGVEIGRANVPAGALDATTPATAHEVTDAAATFVVDPSLLREGDNVLAVEVHNTDLGSSDLSFIPRLWGYDTVPPDAVITRGPFVQQVTRTGALVVWETDLPAPSQVAFGETEAFGLVAEDATAKTRHVVALPSLLPARPYYYQVQSAQVPSTVGRFVTEVNRADPFVVGVFGDTRSQPEPHRSVVTALASHAPHLALLTGDLVSDGEVSGQWDAFCDIESVLIRDVPLYPCIGNHEGDGQLYLGLFELPGGSPAPELYYSVHYGTMLAIALDQYQNAVGAGSEQAAWLEQVLADSQDDPNVRLRIVYLHSGPYDSGSHGSNMTVRNDLVPLFEQYGVDAVFSGHDHDYERGTVNGIKYVVTGGGGAPLYAVSGDTWTEVSASEYHYCTIEVEGPVGNFTARLADGTVLDSFVLGGPESECSDDPASECQPFEPVAPCPGGEVGSWQCVQGACIWNCESEEPPVPDGGVGGSGATGAAGGAGGVGASGGATYPLAGPGSSGDDGGCGCRVGASSSPRALLGGLVAALAALAGARRRRKRR